MKKNFIVALMMLVAGLFLISVILPVWWCIIWIIMIVVLFDLSVKQALWTGGLSIGFIWLSAAIYFMLKDENDLIGKTGIILGGISGYTLLAVTFFLAFITGLLSGWLGGIVNAVIRSKSREQKNIIS